MRRHLISTWIVQDLPVDEAAATLAESGFEDVELSGSRQGLVQAWEDDPTRVVGTLRAAGLRVSSIHSPNAGRSIDVTDEADRLASIQANVAYFERMQASGVPEIVIHPSSSGEYSPPDVRAHRRRTSIESLRVLAERADAAGVRLAVENLGADDRPGSRLTELLEMTDGLGDHVGLCFDVGHAEQGRIDLVEQLRAATSAGKLFSLHLHDVDPANKDHWIPGEGRIDWDVFLDALDAGGFSGLRTLEVSPPADHVADRVRHVAAVREAWERRP